MPAALALTPDLLLPPHLSPDGDGPSFDLCASSVLPHIDALEHSSTIESLTYWPVDAATGITASEASILMLYYGLVLLLPGLAVTTRVRVTFTYDGKVQHLVEGDYDPTHAFDITDASRAFAITGMHWATSYDILVELVYDGRRVVVEHHREQLSLLAWRPSGRVTGNADGVKRIRADFQVRLR